jgi:hypothetical protein
VGETERELDQPLVASGGELVERVSTVEKVDVGVEPLGEGAAAQLRAISSTNATSSVSR